MVDTSIHKLSVNNSIIIDHVLTNPRKDPIYVNDATVSLTILDKNEVPLPDETWPMEMPYQLGSNGLYSVSIIALPSIKNGEKFFIVIDVDGADGLQGQFRTEAVGVFKDF